MNEIPKHVMPRIQKEMLEAAGLANEISKFVMDANPSVGRGILASSMSLVMLSKNSPAEIGIDQLVDLVRATYELINDSESEGEHVH